MDFLEQAKTLYRKRHIHAGALSPNDQANLALSITKLVRSSLTQQGGESSFQYLPFLSVIRDTVAGSCFQGPCAASAFSQLERYLLLLLAQPWKREFWRLKTYGGFFCTKVKAHLHNPEEILQLVGYMREEETSSSSCLVLDHPPDFQIVLNVAFDCQVAMEECLYIGEYYDKMKVVGLTLSDAMEVLLSGSSSTDPVLPPFPIAVLKSNNNNVGGAGMVSDPRKGAPRDVMQPFSAAGRIVTAGSNLVHQVAGGVPALAHPGAPGLPPRPAPGYNPMHHQQSYPYAASQQRVGLGVKTEVPGGAVVGGGGGFLHTPGPGSRGGYASSAGAQSSGYGSGLSSSITSSAYGAPSVFLGSSSAGYPNNASSVLHPHHHHHSPALLYNNNNYPFPAQTLNCGGGDQVDSPPAMTHPPPPPPPPPPVPPCVSPRHYRQLPLPPRSPADFPYMDDDDLAARVIPEATHEQHLQESYLSVEGGGGGGGGGSVGPEVVRRDCGVVGVKDGGVGLLFDPWDPMAKEVRLGVAVSAGGGGGHSSSSMVHRPCSQKPSSLLSDNVRYPSAPSQPATAVMSFSMSLSSASAMDDPRQKAANRPYPLLTALGTAVVPGSGENHASNSPASLHDGSAQRFGEVPPAYYPPDSSRVPIQHYTDAAPPPVPQSKKPPTFAQMVTAPGRASDSRASLLARQAQGSSTATFASQEKGQQSRLGVSSGRGRSGSSSEVILREKVQMKAGPVRGSSLVTPGGRGSDQGFTRQSSQSMDLGMLKWRCRTCTMENSAVESICSACSKSRNAPDLQFSMAGESKRVCPACTFENQPGCSACEVCSTALLDVHTYV
ncbi:hypothetical protein ACOMHN_004426 [Nucella lapillus]